MFDPLELLDELLELDVLELVELPELLDVLDAVIGATKASGVEVDPQPARISSRTAAKKIRTAASGAGRSGFMTAHTGQSASRRP